MGKQNVRTLCFQNPRLLVFDLDGTLVDSRQDLVSSVNATLAHLRRPALPDTLIASYIGDGAAMLVRRALDSSSVAPSNEETLHTALDFFLKFYRAHKLDHTYVYPGVLRALATLRAALPSIRMACLTNKPVAPSRAICEALGLTPCFFKIYGGDSFGTKKPHPEGLLTLIAEASALAQAHDPLAPPITAAQTIVIGDSLADILTARAAGAASIGCAYGFAPKSLTLEPPDAIAQCPEDWPPLLLEEPTSTQPAMQSNRP